MRFTRSLWMIPLLLTAVSAAADIEPSATRILMNGQTRIYRTYGWAMDAEMFAPISQELQKQGLVSQWQPGQDQVTLGWNGAVSRWRVVRSLDVVRTDRSRTKDGSQAEALEIGRELFLPVRATLALMGGTVMWDAPRRTLVLEFAAGGATGRVTPPPSFNETRRPAGVPQTPTGEGAVITGLRWSENAGGLALDVEASAPVRAQTLRLENPSRLVIDFSPATFGLNTPLEPRGAVRTVRTGQFQPGVARVVLDLSGANLAASVPIAAQSQFSIRLGGGGGASGAASQPVAVVPRTATVRKVATNKRGGGLPIRSGLFQGRDVEKIRELLAQGEIMLRGKVICIDAGHGGHSAGARGVTTDIWEKNLCLQMALEAARALRDAGATVILTRGDDTYLSLDERINLANEKAVDLFISIHCNAMPRANTMTGTETYYCTPQSLDLARAMHSGMVGAMGGRDGGIRRRGFAVIRRTTMPSVLLEVGYINAEGDEQKLSDTNYQRSVGEAIRDGVIRYFAG